MVLSVTTTAFAAWPVYNGNDNHNGQITTGVPNIVGSPSVDIVSLPNNGSGWDGVDTQTVMRTVGNTTYAYVVYDSYTVNGGNGGGRLAKVNCNTGSVIWTKQVSLTSGFQLSTPLLVEGATEADDVMYLGVTGYSQLLANDSLNNITPNPWTVTGGTQTTSGVVVFGNNTATLTQSGFTMSTTASNRAAIGILAGTSSVPPAANVTVNVYLGSTTGTPVVTQSFTPGDAIPDSTDPTNLYYYVNTNFAAGTYNAPITVTVAVTNSASVLVDYIDLYQQTGSIQKVTQLNSATAPSTQSIVTDITGQINTPITKYGNYIYFGTYSGLKEYYQVNVAASPATKSIFVGDSDFYWAGAYSNGDYVYFGGDNAKFYWRSVANFATVGGTINLANYVGDAGNVRSSLAADGTNLFFTTQGTGGHGYIWRASITTPTAPTFSLYIIPTSSTSTPAISENGILYVSYYNGFTNGGVLAYDPSTLGLLGAVCTDKGPVQCSPIVYTDNEITGYDYIYFTTNTSPGGGGYCYSFDGTTPSPSPVWTSPGTGSNQYSLQGFSSDNGYLVYGDDADNLYIVSP
jgi:hypothetical protein